ncbi:MAG: RecX family transcriptional regulator [Alphaproteobacteria bacterium]|nr:RecX family transcriptional regulator [Alphaproteobacteria bacterium]
MTDNPTDQQKRAAGDKPEARRKLPRKATPKSLENAALYHLERFSSSAANLRRVLMRRVERSARAHGTDRDGGAAAIDEIVTRFVSSGLLNDRAYAEARAGTLHRRGASARKIRATLMQKGVGQDDIEAALDTLRDEDTDPEFAAAVTLARRRRLGPFRPGPDREARREKDLAALARAGFGYDIARQVIEAPDIDALEAR